MLYNIYMMLAQTEQLAVYHNYLTIMEVRTLRSWAQKLGATANLAINIGAGAGTSALALLEGNPKLRVISIDINLRQLELERKAVREAGFIHGRHAQILEDSVVEGQMWSSAVDLVFVDGDHTYNQVKADIQAWLPHIREGGILCGHDYGWEKWAGVKQAFDEETVGLTRIALVDHLIGYFV